jgi:putative restriction endonuclease
VRAVVLDSGLGSQYEDTPTSYEFPQRYLEAFSPLREGEPMVAVIYEPRGRGGRDGRGRMSYVGWARITDPPVPTRRTEQGQLWSVQYVGAAYAFDRPVPREYLNDPLEGWQRDLPSGRARNVRMVGRAVRPLELADLQVILELGYGGELRTEVVEQPYPEAGQHAVVDDAVQERTRKLVEVIQRDARFRDTILTNYAFQCAISGFTIGRASPTRLHGLLEAAHIRPVSEAGSDSVSNGLALTPTLHRLFDGGFFTLNYRDDRLVVEVSSQLEPTMIESADGSFRMPLRNELPLTLPQDRANWPSATQLRYHRSHAFRGAG